MTVHVTTQTRLHTHTSGWSLQEANSIPSLLYSSFSVKGRRKRRRRAASRSEGSQRTGTQIIQHRSNGQSERFITQALSACRETVILSHRSLFNMAVDQKCVCVCVCVCFVDAVN
ncbi:unnamed protein product [Leuciscus chuanchicus]